MVKLKNNILEPNCANLVIKNNRIYIIKCGIIVVVMGIVLSIYNKYYVTVLSSAQKYNR